MSEPYETLVGEAVQFKNTDAINGIADAGGYPEPGMKARILSVEPEWENVRVTFDFAEFEAENDAIDGANPCYFLPGTDRLGTAKEAGRYKPQDDYIFDMDTVLSNFEILDPVAAPSR